MGPCSECGAAVGHQMILVTSELWTHGSEPSNAYRACSLGGDVVPRAEYSRVVQEAEDWERNAGEEHGKVIWITRRAEVLGTLLKETLAERDAYLANLTSTQARCTELLEENRALKFTATLKRITEEHAETLAALKDCTCIEENDQTLATTSVQDCYKHGGNYCGAV